MKEENSQQRGAIGAHWYTNSLPENRAPKTNVDVVEKKVNSETKISTREVCVPHGRPIIRPEGAKRCRLKPGHTRGHRETKMTDNMHKDELCKCAHRQKRKQVKRGKRSMERKHINTFLTYFRTYFEAMVQQTSVKA